jgi:hypothetical protein
MTDKIYTVAGVSKHKGEFKVRFANDTMRVKVLEKHDHTEVVLTELPKAMLKLDAVKYIATLDEFNTVGAKAAIMDYLDRKDTAPKASAVKTPVKAKTPAKAKAAVTVDEDAPF